MLNAWKNFGGGLEAVDETGGNIVVRPARAEDLNDIRDIYNQGIADRIATLDSDLKTPPDMDTWWTAHEGRYTVIVAVHEAAVVGWSSLNPYSQRPAYRGVAELSVYVDRAWRGRHVGRILLRELEGEARRNGFYKIVLFTFPHNQAGQRLYRGVGYREVGTFYRQGYLDGRYVDVMAMEKFIADGG